MGEIVTDATFRGQRLVRTGSWAAALATLLSPSLFGKNTRTPPTGAIRNHDGLAENTPQAQFPFRGLHPYAPGLWQTSVTIPNQLPITVRVSLRGFMDGADSNEVGLFV